MKNILLLLLAVAVSFSFSCSSGNKSSSNKNGSTNVDDAGWSTLDYHYRTGTVGPEYYYHYKVLVNSDKTAQFIFYYSYADTGFTQESFTITDSQLKTLSEAVNQSKVLDGDIPAMPENEHPIGGSTETLAVIVVNPNPDLDQSPKRIEVPAFPQEKYRAGLEKLYSTINGLIPAGMLETARNKKEEMNK